MKSHSKTAQRCAELLNFKCREAKLSIPNPEVGFQKPRKTAKAKTGYHNIFWSESREKYVGSKIHNTKRVEACDSDALMCAKILNFKCREADFPIPNPGFGFQKPSKRRRRKSSRAKNLQKRKPTKKRPKKRTKSNSIRKAKKKSTRKKRPENKLGSGILISVKKERLNAYDAYKKDFSFKTLKDRNDYLPCFSVSHEFPDRELKYQKQIIILNF